VLDSLAPTWQEALQQVAIRALNQHLRALQPGAPRESGRNRNQDREGLGPVRRGRPGQRGGQNRPGGGGAGNRPGAPRTRGGASTRPRTQDAPPAQAPEPQVDAPTPAAEAPPEATTPPPAEKPKAAPRKKKADS